MADEEGDSSVAQHLADLCHVRRPALSDSIEIWHTPTVGDDPAPLLLEARAFDPSIDPPKVYRLANGTLLLAATTECTSGADGYRYRVECVELTD
jgi:hypothetical protein